MMLFTARLIALSTTHPDLRAIRVRRLPVHEALGVGRSTITDSTLRREVLNSIRSIDQGRHRRKALTAEVTVQARDMTVISRPPELLDRINETRIEEVGLIHADRIRVRSAHDSSNVRIRYDACLHGLPIMGDDLPFHIPVITFRLDEDRIHTGRSIEQCGGLAREHRAGVDRQRTIHGSHVLEQFLELLDRTYHARTRDEQFIPVEVRLHLPAVVLKTFLTDAFPKSSALVPPEQRYTVRARLIHRSSPLHT